MPTYKDINLLTQKAAMAGTEKLPVSDTEYITPDQIVAGVEAQIEGGSISKALTWTDGWIATNGVISSSSQSKFTQPFLLKKGEKVTVSTNNTNICIIGTTTAQSLVVGNTITVLQTTGTVAQTETHVYTATSDINLVVCVRWSDHTIAFEQPGINSRLDALESEIGDIATILASI